MGDDEDGLIIVPLIDGALTPHVLQTIPLDELTVDASGKPVDAKCILFVYRNPDGFKLLRC